MVSKQLGLDVRDRDRLVRRLLDELTRAATGSRAMLRGSLASEHPDIYADIDVTWQVPDSEFLVCIDNAREILSRVASVESLRSDPPLQKSLKHRMLFVRFEGVPLFWRVDLDVYAESVGIVEEYDRENPEARSADWSYPESALSNAVLALKMRLRGRKQEERELIERGYRRVGLEFGGGDLFEQVAVLCDSIKVTDPRVAGLADRVEKLAAEIAQVSPAQPTERSGSPS